MAENPSWISLNILPCGTELEKSDPNKASELYEKAISENAGSYKLWHAYLLHLTRLLQGKPIDDSQFDIVNKTFERALVFMHRMPRIWIEYCTLLDKQLFVTKTRKSFDRALEALPVTQHARIWPLYINFIKQKHVPAESAIRVFKRYMQFQPEDAESFIDYLHSKGHIDEATKLLCNIINRPNFQSQKNKTKHELWEELCDMICEYPDQIESIDCEAVLRDGIDRYPDQRGKLWNSLARYFVRLGMFSSARSIYEEGLEQVTTKKDFVEIWEAYTRFEEKYIELLLEKEELTPDEMLDLEMRQAALEYLISNNGLLLNRVALRQNRHNVREWLKRVELQNDDHKADTFREAIKSVEPRQALGSYPDLWIGYAFFHAKAQEIDRAREIFEEAVLAEYVKYDDLAQVWCAYIELELAEKSDKALKLAKRATSQVKNLKLWSLYVDLEEEHGNFDSTKAVYERIIDLKLATPNVILNYAAFMEEHNYFEESFRAFERGVALFKWPYSCNIWYTYLNKFLNRFGYKKLDRLRDLLDKALHDCTSKHAFELYLLYAQIEEEEGLLSRAQAIYERAMGQIENKRKFDMFKIYVRSMSKLVDIATIRNIYEKAISSLDNKGSRYFCLEYARIEESLNEVDRARTIYAYCSQMCDPKSDKEFWRIWTDFEQRYGDLESIDEMLRIKRSIEAMNLQPEYLTDVTIESATIAKAIDAGGHLEKSDAT